ncbi:MAG: hypothetical protein WAM14_11685 [Candidatus Nitrosopolaris sp.]
MISRRVVEIKKHDLDHSIDLCAVPSPWEAHVPTEGRRLLRERVLRVI